MARTKNGNTTEFENPLLLAATAALAEATGIQLVVDTRKPNIATGDQQADALVHPTKMPDIRWATKIKIWANHAPLGMLIQQLKAMPITGLLVADYINPPMAEKLKDHNVQFIDTAGNAYLNQHTLFVWVTGKKPLRQKDEKPARKKAFNTPTLKIIYCALLDDTLLNTPYRNIAVKAGVALGTVGDALDQLKAQGFVTGTPHEKNWKLDNRKKLLQKWAEQFPDKVLARHHAGTFITDDPQWWETFDLQAVDGYWGGEVAAAKLTGYLKPKTATVYVDKDKMGTLLQKARLRKPQPWEMQEAGIVDIYTLALDQQPTTDKRTVHPLIVYTELMATDDPRNLETAEKIYEQYIEPIGQN